MSDFASLPVVLPKSTIPKDANIVEASRAFLSKIETLSGNDFHPDAVWRDVFALTGSLRTFYGPRNIAAKYRDLISRAEAHSFTFDASNVQTVTVGETARIDAKYQFETDAEPAQFCTAILSLVYCDDGVWRIWILRTILEQLKGQPNVDVLEPQGSLKANGQTELESVKKTHLDCVVVGGGQAGLSVAGRLKALGISYVVLEKNKQVGDNWRLRYKSTKLHTNRASSHLPFARTFTPEYQEWLTKDELAKGYREWMEKFRINVLLDTALISGRWHADTELWELFIRTSGDMHVLKCKFVVLALGAGGQKPLMPAWEGKDSFRGVAMHSVNYQSPVAWKDKRGVVVGTANTAHDVAEDMLAAGLSSVTMIQRSPTYVLPAEYYKRVQDVHYNDTFPTITADVITHTSPLGVGRLFSQQVLHSMARAEPERFDRLEAAGFKLIRYGDIFQQLFTRLGGHYMDVGASEKISNGQIKIKSDSLAEKFTSDGILFNDGSELKADVVIFATGFRGNMRDEVREFFGDEIANQVEDYWGIDDEGEIRGAWRPSGQPALWYSGGTIGQARYFSRFVALQIKAACLGTPLWVYEKHKTKTHNSSSKGAEDQSCVG